MNEVSFNVGAVTEAQKEAVKSIITNVIEDNFKYLRKRVNAELDKIQSDVKDEIFYNLELLLSGKTSICMGDGTDA